VPKEPIHLLQDLMPLAATLGLTVERWEPGEVQISVTWRPELCTSGGLLHGGVIMAVADSAGATCAFLNLPEGAGTTTVESKTNFLRAIRDGAAEARARPLHTGRTVIVVETEIRDAEGRLAAKVTQSQLVLRV